jgi:endoplasmic reticulum chaperone BiP
MVTDAAKYEAEDKEVEAKVTARNALDRYVYEVRKQIKDKDIVRAKLTAEEVDELKKAVKRVTKWFTDSAEASSRQDIENQHKKFESTVNPLLAKAFGQDAVNSDRAGTQDIDDLDDL